MAKIEVKISNGCYSAGTHGGRIYSSGWWSHNNSGGSCCSGETREEVNKSIEELKIRFAEEGNTAVIIDERTKIDKGKLEAWMGTPNAPKVELKIKFELMWKLNKEHEKRHYILKWINFEEFGDMIGKLGYVYCCNWYDGGSEIDNNVLSHEVQPMELLIQKWLEENELDYDWEITKESTENFSNSQFRWDIIGEAGKWYDKLVEHCGFDDHKGYSVHSVKDIKKLYKEAKNKAQFKIYIKKCSDLWYECECREANENGDFVEGFTPHKEDFSAKNILSIKKWVDTL